MRKPQTTEKQKQAILEALKKTLGIISRACDIANISRSQYYIWYNSDAEFKEAVDKLEEYTLDFVESHLLQQIKNDNTTATIFYLKTKGKKRGYREDTIVNFGTINNTLDEAI